MGHPRYDEIPSASPSASLGASAKLGDLSLHLKSGGAPGDADGKTIRVADLLAFSRRATGETQCRTLSAFAPTVRCSRSRRRPRVRFRSGHGTCGGHEHPAPAPGRSIAPSKAVPPAVAWGSNRLPPSARSGRRRAALHSYCADIRLRQPSLARGFPFNGLQQIAFATGFNACSNQISHFDLRP